VGALTDPGYAVVAIANPEHAPYGRAARQALEAAGAWDAVSPRLVLGENIMHAYQFVRTGNADAGLVALGLVRGVSGPPVPYTLVDSALHAPLRQVAGVVAGTGRAEQARRFLDFVMSADGRGVLARFGFERP
jgi:molybdate transport system substrate-binding protein